MQTASSSSPWTATSVDVAQAPVGVVGAGTLGTTVAHLALAGEAPTVVVVRPGAEKQQRAVTAVRRSLQREVDAGRLTPDAFDAHLRRLTVTSDVAELGGCALVVESVPEDVAEKRAVLAEVEPHISPDTVYASTTSTIPASMIASAARHPERVFVAHYVWPAHRVPLVEVAFPCGADPRAAHRLLATLAGQGKRWVTVSDTPGFFITRALFAYWDEALALVCEGVSPDHVDAVHERFGWPRGPLRVLDSTGLASVARIAGFLAPHVGNRFPRLPALEAVAALGFAGAGSAGLYCYDGPASRRPNGAALALLPTRRAPAAAGVSPLDRTMFRLAAEVARCVDEHVVASWEEAAFAIESAFGFPAGDGGLLGWLHESADRLVATSAAMVDGGRTEFTAPPALVARLGPSR